jgi:GNAT superfamily N-acetyltransferase
MIEIKPLTANDTEMVIDLIKQFSSGFDPVQMIEHWKKQMEEYGYAFGAFMDGKLLGSMGGRLQLPYGTIDYMFIHPDHRNNKIGNQLLKTIEEFMQKNYVDKILASNEKEISLFLRTSGYKNDINDVKIKEFQYV